MRLISSPEFFQKHLERSKAKSHHPHIVKFHDSEIEILSYYANNLTSKKIDVKGKVHLLGSCDGLVLYHKSDAGEIEALNPATGEVAVNARLTNISNDLLDHYLISAWFGHLICTWFGRHPATGEYVLVIACVKYPKFGERSKNIVFRVYGLSRSSLLSSSYEEVDRGSFFGCPDIGTFLHGRVHVLRFFVQDSKRDEILAYDLRTNRMVRMLAPLVKPSIALGVLDGHLCALHDSGVWMMKEYGVEGSWTKYANIGDKISIPIQICPDGDVILCDKFLKAFRDRERVGRRYGYVIFMGATVVACIDSLVSPAVVLETKEHIV